VHGATDGLVPLESSRLDGARSDVVLPSDHDVQETPLAVLEVRRILRLHLRERKARRRPGRL